MQIVQSIYNNFLLIQQWDPLCFLGLSYKMFWKKKNIIIKFFAQNPRAWKSDLPVCLNGTFQGLYDNLSNNVKRKIQKKKNGSWG